MNEEAQAEEYTEEATYTDEEVAALTQEIQAPSYSDIVLPFRHIKHYLSRPLPDHLLKEREGPKKKMLTYFPWWAVNIWFDMYAPGWCSEITSVVVETPVSVNRVERQWVAGKVQVEFLPDFVTTPPQTLVTVKLYVPSQEFGFPGTFRTAIGGEWANIDYDLRPKGFIPGEVASRAALRRAAMDFGMGFGLNLKDQPASLLNWFYAQDYLEEL